MHRFALAVVLVGASALLSSCSDPARVTAPAAGAPALARGGATERVVNMLDACDPATFNTLGAGTCLRNGGMKLSQFIALLTKHQEVGAWHFAPPVLNVVEGTTLVAINHGGEEHTFTEVDEFGGGIVPLLNQLSGNTEVAEECQQLEDEDFVPPGGTYPVTEEEAGTELYMCCIHPWMRTTVHVHEP